MALRIVIVGPGRVGSAMAARLHASGGRVLGFVGRDPAASEAAVRRCGAGRALGLPDLASAHVVLFTVGDDSLGAAVDAARAAGAARSCSLWMHTSGRHGLEVFAAVGPRVRVGALHPAVPIPDAAAGIAALAGAPALLEAGPRAERLVRRVAAMVGLVPIAGPGIDRITYHAACALAANGLTALRAAVDRTFAAAGGLDVAGRRCVADALMAAALRACSTDGPAAALSGPVRRGDVDTVRAHVERLADRAADALPAYRALMLAALALCPDLAPDRARALRDALRPPPGAE